MPIVIFFINPINAWLELFTKFSSMKSRCEESCSQRALAAREILADREVCLKANSSGNKRNPSDKSTVHESDANHRMSAVSA